MYCFVNTAQSHITICSPVYMGNTSANLRLCNIHKTVDLHLHGQNCDSHTSLVEPSINIWWYDPSVFDFCLSTYIQVPLGYMVENPGGNWSAWTIM